MSRNIYRFRVSPPRSLITVHTVLTFDETGTPHNVSTAEWDYNDKWEETYTYSKNRGLSDYINLDDVMYVK